MRSASSCCRSRMRCVASMDSWRAFRFPSCSLCKWPARSSCMESRALAVIWNCPASSRGRAASQTTGGSVSAPWAAGRPKGRLSLCLGGNRRSVHLHIPLFRRGVVQGHDLFKGQEQNFPALGAFPQILWFPPQDVQREERQHPGKRSAPGDEARHGKAFAGLLKRYFGK